MVYVERMATEDPDEGCTPWVIGVRLVERELQEKLKRMIEAQEARSPGLRVSAGGILRGLLKEAPEP